MPQKIELLFAGGFSRVERSMLGEQGLQLPIALSIFLELRFGARERVEQIQLFIRRKQRLVIMRPMKIDKVIAELFQDRQCGGRTVDELAVGAARG